MAARGSLVLGSGASYTALVKRKITLDLSEMSALNRLRGLPEGAHMMVMSSRVTSTGGVLEGPREAFEELVHFISEDISEGLASQKDLRALISLCRKIDPGCVEWLGS